MEQPGLFDLEMSLFNGDLQLVGLDSTPAAEPLLFDETSVIPAPLLPDTPGSDLALKAIHLTPEVAIPDNSGYDVLDAAWLSTRVDLQLLLPSQEQPVDWVPPQPVVESMTPVVCVAANVEECPAPLADASPNIINLLPTPEASQVDTMTAGDLFDSMIFSAHQSTSQEDLLGDGDISADNLLLEVLGKLTDQLGQPASSDLANKDSVLSPVSVEDVEHFLSSPSSPAESSVSSWSDSNESYSESLKTSRHRKRKSDESDVPEEIVDKKLRKKMQNKTAALRYRNKKKVEKGTISGECEELEKKNSDLRDQVDSISREINYLKNLMHEVRKAKGLRD